jgi:phosphatidyl-myo-inositol dimannoside synthase
MGLRMKILILATDIYNRGGVARFTSTFGSSLGRLLGRSNVHVLALLDTGALQHAPLDCTVVAALSGRPTVLAKLRFAFRALYLGARGYDLIVCSHVALSPLATLIRLFFGTPYWVICHGSEVCESLSVFLHEALQRANLVLAVSEFTAKVLVTWQNLLSSRVSVLYNAIPEDFVELLQSPPICADSGSQQPIILSVGSLSNFHIYKGFDSIIESLPSLVGAIPGLKYVIVGDGADRRRLEELAKRKGVSEHVDFIGSICDAELARRYRECSVFALPSRSISDQRGWSGEGFGRVYIEAAFAGKAVVGSTEGGAAEAVAHNRTGFLVNPNSSSEILKALMKLLKDPRLAMTMGIEGQRWASSRFSMSTQIDSLRTLLQPYLRSAREGLPAADRRSSQSHGAPPR